MQDYLRLDIEKSGLEIHLVREHKVLNRDSSPAELFAQDLQIAQAAFVSRNIALEARKGMRKKAEQGIYPSYAPLGYVNVTDKKGRKVIVPDPERADSIARLFKFYVKPDRSLNDVVRLTQAIGLDNRNGRTPSRSAIHKILRNPVYKGIVRWRNHLYRGIHDPLVDPNLWQKVQWKLTGGKCQKSSRERNSFVFSGLIKCRVCGCALSADRKKGKYTYYHCTGYRGKHGEPYVREEELNRQFAELLDLITIDDEIIEWVMDTIVDETSVNMEKHTELISAIQSEIHKEERKLDLLYDDRLDGRVSTDIYDRKSSEIHEAIDIKKSKIAELKSQDVSQLPQQCRRTLELSKSAHELFLDAPDHEKRKMIRSLLSNCTWSQGELDAEFLHPFGSIADANLEWNRVGGGDI